MEILKVIKFGALALAAYLTSLWGTLGWLIVGLIICLVIDYVTGTLVASTHNAWRSARAREGVLRKFGCIGVVVVSGVFDWLIGTVILSIPAINLPFEYSTLFCPIVVVWYIITELGSILENLVTIGTPVPGWLTKMLKVAQDAVDSTGDKLIGEDTNESSK